MYAVIFKARIAKFDEEYFGTASRLRELAFSQYGCLDFVSATEGDEEIAISYWSTRQQIRDWKNDPEHRKAQTRSRGRWYSSVSVEVCEVLRSG